MPAHRRKGRGAGPGQGAGNGSPKAPPLDTSPEKQRARAHKRWAAWRERRAAGPEAVELHRRKLVLERERREVKALARSIPMPPRAGFEGT